MSCTGRPIEARSLIALVGLAAVVAAVVVNPLRETAFTDDWVYATMVRRLLDTRRFQMHPWAAANPWFLIVWGAFFSKLFGLSFVTLRLSALTLNAIGLVSLFLLCREHRLESRESALLTLVFFASPLIVRHAFSFMSDVPFIALCTLSLLFYTRAFRTERLALMLAGSLCAAGAVLMRQFGAAFVPALGLVWLRGTRRLQRLPLVLVGVLMPLVAIAWQIQQGTQETAWTARLRTAEQVAFVKSPTFAIDLLWRAAVVPVHLALYALPLVLVGFYLGSRRGGSAIRPAGLGVGVSLTYLVPCVVVLYAGAKVLDRPVLMPLLDWNLAALSSWPRPLRALLTTLLVLLGAWLCSRLARRYRDPARRPTDSAETLLDALSFFLLVEQLIYVQFSDRYLLPFLPFVLVVVGRELWLDRPVTKGELRSGIALALVMLTISTAWERDTLARGEALWSGGEWLRLKGVSAEQVHSESWEWEYYQGSFERWLARQTDPDKADFNDFFDRFWPEAWRKARYLVAVRELTPTSNPGQAVLRTIPYRDALLRRRFVEVIDRHPLQPGVVSSLADRRPER